MKMPVRLSWDPAFWMQTTNFGELYCLFGSVVAVIDVAAILTAAILVWLARGRGSFPLTLPGAALMA